MKKRFRKTIVKIWHNTYFKIAFYLVCLVAILLITGQLKGTGSFSIQKIFDKIMEILKKEETISFFTAGILTLVIATIVRKIDIRLEEDLKINDDHHKIISTYDKHNQVPDYDHSKNYNDKVGAYMTIGKVPEYRNEKNYIRDKYSSLHQDVEKLVNSYNQNENPKLILPSLNLFTNFDGKTQIKFNDSADLHPIPDFVMNNVNNIITAHKYSKTTNNLTVRLNDYEYNNGVVTLDTMRSYYYHMLLTNRCMDYKLQNGMTIRGLYEYEDKITPLKDSKLSNQIGINGVVITNDNYLLIEKRDRKKTTWKNKFAQPISLAFKYKETKLSTKTIPDDINTASEVLKTIIFKTLNNNFGIVENDIENFTINESFLGIARDLLEGGKPNIYFYVRLKDNASKVKEKLEEFSKSTDVENCIKKNKLTSKYFLVPYDKINIDFEYALKLKKKDVLKINRKLSPRVNKAIEYFDKFTYNFGRILKPNLKYECGEALLASLSYLEICSNRIKLEKEDKHE